MIKYFSCYLKFFTFFLVISLSNTIFSQYNVEWENFVKTVYSSTSLQKQVSTNGTGTASSVNLLYGWNPNLRNGKINYDGDFTYTPTNNNENKKIGFSSVDSKTILTSQIEYGFSFLNNGKVKAFAFDSEVTVNYSANQEFRIKRVEDLMQFYVNNALVLEVKIDKTENLLLRAELTTNGSSFNNVKVSFDTKRLIVAPILNHADNTIKMNIIGGFPPFQYFWEDGEKYTFPSNENKEVRFSEGIHKVRIKDAQNNEFERFFSIGNDLTWTSFLNTQQLDLTLKKILPTLWGQALSTATIAKNDPFWLEYIAIPEQTSKAFGILYTNTVFTSYSNLEAGFLLAKDNQLQIIDGGNIVLTTEYSDKDALLLVRNEKTISWLKNGVEIYKAEKNLTTDLKIGGLLKDNSTLTGVHFFNTPINSIQTTWDETSFTGKINVDITSITSQAGPFHYYISQDPILPLHDIYKLTRDSIFGGTLDSIAFFEGDAAQLQKDAQEQNKINQLSLLKQHIFSDLESGKYNVSIFDKTGLLILGKEVKISPQFKMYNNDGINQNTDLYVATKNNASTDIDFYLSESIEKTNIDFKITNTVDKYAVGFVNLEDLSKTLLYGFEVNKKNVQLIVDGVIQTIKYPIKADNILSIVKENEKLVYQINGITKFETTLNIESIYYLKLNIHSQGPNAIQGTGVIITPGPVKNPNPTYTFIANVASTTCTTKLGSSGTFHFESSYNVNNITYSITNKAGTNEVETEVQFGSSLNKNVNVDITNYPAGIYKISGTINYSTANGVQHVIVQNNYTEYFFVGIVAEMTEPNIDANNNERRLSDFLISPTEIGYVRFNPKIDFYSNTNIEGSSSQISSLFDKLFYLTTQNANFSENPNNHRYIAFKNISLPDIQTNRHTRIYWNSPVEQANQTVKNTEPEYLCTVIFKANTIEFFYGKKFNPSQPIFTIDREANENYWFATKGYYEDITHSFNCYNSGCNLALEEIGTLCPNEDVQLTFVNQSGSGQGSQFNGYTFDWEVTPTDCPSCFDCQYCPNPVFKNSINTTLVLKYAKSGFNCPQITQEIIVLQENCKPELCLNKINNNNTKIGACPNELTNVVVENLNEYDLNLANVTWSPNYNIGNFQSPNTFFYPEVTTTYTFNVSIPGQYCTPKTLFIYMDKIENCKEESPVVDIIGCCFSNYGAGVYIAPSTHLNVYCNVINEVSLVGGVLQKGEFINKGKINTTKDWIHNAQNKLFTSYEGDTYLFGNYQSLSGNSNIYFNDLILDGSSKKEIFNDEYAFRSLNLNDIELATRNHTFSLLETNPLSLARNNGFVSTEKENGYFFRNIDYFSGLSQAYLYPMGSTGKIDEFGNITVPYRYRPLELKSNEFPTDFKIHFENDIVPIVLNPNLKAPNVSSVNSEFYYKFSSTDIAPNISITAYYNPNDGNFQAISHWSASNVTTPSNWWKGTPGSSGTTIPSVESNTLGLLSATTNSAVPGGTSLGIDLISENFSLAQSGFYIGTDDFGTGEGGTNGGNGNTTGVIITVTSTGTGNTGGGLGDPNPTGPDDVILTPNPVAGTYQIDIQAGSCSVPGKIQFTVELNGSINPNTIYYIYDQQQEAIAVNKLASDLYDIDGENSGLNLSSKPNNIEECLNSLKISMGNTNIGNENMILKLNAGVISEAIILSEAILPSGTPNVFNYATIGNLTLYKSTSTAVFASLSFTANTISSATLNNYTWTAGAYRFELPVTIGGVSQTIKGQFIVK